MVVVWLQASVVLDHDPILQQVDDDHLVVKSGEEGEFCGDDLDSSCKVSGLKTDEEVSGFDFDLLALACSLKIDLSEPESGHQAPDSEI